LADYTPKKNIGMDLAFWTQRASKISVLGSRASNGPMRNFGEQTK
jgi:hypothetical protein